MPDREDELQTALEAHRDVLCKRFPEAGFCLMGVLPPEEMEGGHVHQGFAFVSNAAAEHALVALFAKGLNHIADVMSRVITAPGDLN